MERPKQDPNHNYLRLAWPKYLAQWYAHRQYCSVHKDEEYLDAYQYDPNLDPYSLEPVQTLRDHPERVILEENIAKQTSVPEFYDEGATICIQLPSFKVHRPEFYSRLTEKGKRLLQKYVKGSFDADIVAYVNHMRPLFDGGINKKDAIEAFMDARGIDPEFWDSVIKAHQRAEKRYNRMMHYYHKIRN